MSLPDRSHPVDIQFDVSSALQLALLLLALGLGLWLGHRHSHPTLVLRRRSLVACQIVFMSGFQIMSAAVLLLAQVLPMAGVIYAQFALGLGICFGSGFMGLYLGPSRSLDAFGTSRYG